MVETILKLHGDSSRLTADGHRPTDDSPKRVACDLLRVTGGSTMLYAWMQTVMSEIAEMERAGFRADRHRAAFKPERS
ncbi:MAG: hypothetical protein NTX53_07465 [candidate division WOR-3 bacterium]|nr:hypothetical protein [candidate division WOR-3 bacterium]